MSRGALRGLIGRLAPYRPAIVVIAIASLMLSGFAVSYSLALGRPTPHHVPIAVVGDGASVTELERASGSSLQVTRYPSEAAARRAIVDQHVYGALLADRRPQRLFVSGASGPSVVRVLQSAAQMSSPPIAVTDAHPLSSEDPQGLIMFYVVLAATILGLVTIFQLNANQKGLSERGWMACILALAAFGGLALAIVTDFVLAAIPAPFGVLWALLATQIGIVGMFNYLMLSTIGRWAILPTWALFVLLGNAASGGAVSPPLLPAFYRVVGQILPTGSTIELIRIAVYFPAASHSTLVISLAAWVVGLLAALGLLHRKQLFRPSR